MTVVPCLCGLRFGLLITPDLILQGQGSKTTSIMTLDALKPREGVLILFSLFFLLPFLRRHECKSGESHLLIAHSQKISQHALTFHGIERKGFQL